MNKSSFTKDSGTAWLGHVPAHWQIKPLWSMFRPKKETGHPKEPLLSVYRDYGVIPKASRDDNNNRESEDLSAYQLVEEGELVTNKMKAWQGSIAISAYRGIVSPAYFVYSKQHHENSRYIHNLLRSVPYITGYQSISKGIRVNQWDLDADKFRLFPILIPPAAEQDRITDYIDRETAHIDALIAKKTRFIELLAEKRQALITHAVTKGLNPNAPMKDSSVEWLGEVPAHWTTKKVQYLATKIGSGKTPSGGATVYVEEGIPFLRSQNIYDDGIRLDDVAYITEAMHQEMSNTKVMPWDVLLNITGGSIGRTALVSHDIGEANVNQHVCIVRLQSTPVANWVQMAFRANSTKDQIDALQTGANREGLNFEQVGNIRIAYPPDNELQEILLQLKTRISRIAALVVKTERSIELLREHRRALITAAVTGKIDMRGAA